MTANPLTPEVVALLDLDELRAAVAEHLFRWRWMAFLDGSNNYSLSSPYQVAHMKPEYALGRHQLPERARLDFSHCDLPDYPRDIAAAWQVMEQLRQLRTNVAVWADNGWAVRAWDVDPQARPHMEVRGVDSGNCPTFQIAVCRAALLATLEGPKPASDDSSGQL